MHERSQEGIISEFCKEPSVSAATDQVLEERLQQIMYNRRLSTIALHLRMIIQLKLSQKTIVVQALINSETTCSVIDKRLVQQYKILTNQMKESWEIRNANDSQNVNERITKVTQICIKNEAEEWDQVYVIITLEIDRLVLRMNYLRKRNPTID